MGRSWFATPKPKHKNVVSPEASILALIPPDWSGPLAVVGVSFALFFPCWLADRRLGVRAKKKAREKQKERERIRQGHCVEIGGQASVWRGRLCKEISQQL